MDKSSIEAVIAKIKELVAKGNVSRIVIKSKDGSELVNIPVNAGVVGGVVGLFRGVGCVGGRGIVLGGVVRGLGRAGNQGEYHHKRQEQSDDLFHSFGSS